MSTDSKISHLCPRICSLEETENRVRAVMNRLPITRVANLTPLDRPGLPVWSATTPMAKDLTTHLGKGSCHLAARVSCLMEAVERCSAEELAVRPQWGSFADLTAAGVACLDPRSCDLSAESCFDPALSLAWVEAEDLLGEKPLLVPLDLVLSPPQQGVLREVDTNGLASGNSLLEATVHALSEVIERDAISQHLFTTLYLGPHEIQAACLRIDPLSWPESSGGIAEVLRSEGLKIQASWLPTDINVPIFRVALLDPAYPCRGGTRPRGFLGYGCAPDAELALLRAITESVQSRLAVIQGARDAFNRVPANYSELTWQADSTDQPLHDLSSVGGMKSLNLKEDLDWLCQSLKSAGFSQILRIDLTRADLGIPVVRLRVPGLSCFAVNQRRVGWRCLRFLL